METKYQFVPDEELYAVNLFYQTSDGKILGVSRRHDHNDFGLPGGKIDKGETPIESLIREVKEETGVILNPDGLTPIFERKGETDSLISRTYIYHTNEPLQFTEGIHEKNGGLAKMIEWDDLITGTFGIYNYRLGMSMQRYLRYNWLLSYMDQSDRNYPLIKNAIIDVHPLTWLSCMKKKKKFESDIALISFQQVENNDLKTYGKLY